LKRGRDDGLIAALPGRGGPLPTAHCVTGGGAAKRIEDGDKPAKDLPVNSNLRLVVSVTDDARDADGTFRDATFFFKHVEHASSGPTTRLQTQPMV